MVDGEESRFFCSEGIVSSIEAFVSTETTLVPFLSPRAMDGMDRIRHERARSDDC